MARVEYAAQHGAIAYLAQGDVLLPVGCPEYWTSASTESPASEFRVAAILPTGIADEQVFEGNVEVRTIEESYPDRFAGPNGGGCSMSEGARPAPGLAVSGGFLGGLALIGWCARQRGRLLTGVRGCRRPRERCSSGE